ncbi:PTS system mannose/fructose/sorbose family transporter subunit IID [uncultured Desulfuromusa sp.]|uniref:PTS system mannose/fructose/sorbose family transporter subunit IID n=1 Tax=uncultured Desulfuromusa sp. TaxID=219183 RepID=UPI002AA95E6E|nr:PTS system mannose/fructose/sorbose family transporter subunit IID [uncultured Desulfuromusa sp.]
MAIPRKTRFYIWFRLLLLQASWNFERLQGIGFFYSLLPGLRTLYRGEKLLAVSRRYAGYFNTHVYLAPMVAGAVLKLEEERALGDVDSTLEVDDFKEMVAAPYAAIGDALFWGGLRPLAAGIALFFAVKGILWAPLVFLLLYNILPTWFRTVFFVRGYRQGIKSVEFIQKHRLPDWAIHTKEAAVVVLGGLSAFMVFSHFNQVHFPTWLGMITLIPMVILVLVARKGFSTLLLVFLTVGSIFLIGLFGTDMVYLLKSWGIK